jgi:hypothetical protein
VWLVEEDEDILCGIRKVGVEILRPQERGLRMAFLLRVGELRQHRQDDNGERR